MRDSAWCRALALSTAIALVVFSTGCSRTVTKYDETGKPYSEKEFDPWMTIGGIILFGVILGGIIVAAEANATSELPEGSKLLLAYAKNPEVANDALPILNRQGKWIQVKDAQGRLLSRHLLHLDKIQAGGQVISVSEVQEKVEISEEVLRNLVAELERERESGSPKGIEAELSFQEDDASALRINAVRFLQREDNASTGSQVIVASSLGLFRVSAVPDAESGHVRVTVSELK